MQLVRACFQRLADSWKRSGRRDSSMTGHPEIEIGLSLLSGVLGNWPEVREKSDETVLAPSQY